jgi:hypothetical protein
MGRARFQSGRNRPAKIGFNRTAAAKARMMKLLSARLEVVPFPCDGGLKVGEFAPQSRTCP